ncbi:hypothetical protein BGZ95_004520 [Linnemannia exigua]|uniref:Uncharacterized protein n=1 Tax=Linnemannia exigua TaxID=604196 RepID=A0AAD4H321_9FUNG|nr:hypothetical protein BGZ95_004520 [Linnemannia exigua]
MSPEDVIAALVTMTNSITGGNHVGFEALTKLELGFDIFGDKVDLRWSSLVRLLEAFPYLEMLDLAELNLGAPAATTDNNEQEGDEEIIDEKVDDRTLLRLFGKTPHLKDLYLSFIIITKVDNVIGALPTLCPDLKRLDIITRIPIPDFYTIHEVKAILSGCH